MRTVLSRAAIRVATGLVTAVVLAAEPAAGASPSPGAPASKPQIYLHATLIDTDKGTARPDVAVTVRGDRIEAVGPAREVRSEPGASVVDLHGKYLLPGLINTHVHLATDPDPGLTPMDALRAATVTGARTVGQQASLGSIEAGRLADLVVLRANPLKDIHNIRTVDLVVKHGVRFDRKSYVPFTGRTHPPSD